MAEIRLEGVKKKFGDVTVVEEMNLTVHDGEIFTFVGPSGCGKSTILNMIAGLETVTEGRIYFDNIAVDESSPRDRDVAMVFQSYALYPHMNVYENIAFPLTMKKAPKEIISKEVKRVAAFLGLENMLHRKPKELSGGQRQRVALGRAIIRRPKVFLMDEPLSNLDARLRIEMRAELKSLHRRLKITTIYVTHDQSEAMSLSDRIGVLNNGKMQQCGTALEIYSKPLNTFVAGFIGSPSMNFIEAVVSQKDPFMVIVNGIVFRPLVQKIPEVDRVVLGVRPDDVIVSAEKRERTIEASAELLEMEGAVIWIKVKWKEISIKGKLAGNGGISEGMKVFFSIPDDKIHSFDYRTGARI
jgi:multiple sugar transport system ATP-binding protein